MCITGAPKISGFCSRNQRFCSGFASRLLSQVASVAKNRFPAKTYITAHFCRLRLRKCLMVCTRRPPGNSRPSPENRRKIEKMPEIPDLPGAALPPPAPRLAVSPGERRFGIYSLSRVNDKNYPAEHPCRAQPPLHESGASLGSRSLYLFLSTGSLSGARELPAACAEPAPASIVFTADSSHSMPNVRQPTAKTRRSEPTLLVGYGSQARLRGGPSRQRPAGASPGRRIHPGCQTNPRIGATSEPCCVAAALNAHPGAAVVAQGYAVQRSGKPTARRYPALHGLPQGPARRSPPRLPS